MREAKAELFELIGKADFICITTNGTVKSSGSAVMGRGCALQAKTRWRGLDEYLGHMIRHRGNVPHYLGMLDKFKNWRKGDIRRDAGETGLISFPVKHFWNQPADINLIVNSANLLKMVVSMWQQAWVVIPRPGCGNGGLSWEFVRPHLANVLDDRFMVITNED